MKKVIVQKKENIPSQQAGSRPVIISKSEFEKIKNIATSTSNTNNKAIQQEIEKKRLAQEKIK